MNLKERIEHILQIDLIHDQGLPDLKEAEARANQLISVLQRSVSSESELRRLIDPQWVVLAAGKGSRIDPSGKINKNLDIYFGENNVIQLSRRNLIGGRQHLIAINPDMARRILKEQGSGVRGQGSEKQVLGVRGQVLGEKEKDLPNTQHPTPNTQTDPRPPTPDPFDLKPGVIKPEVIDLDEQNRLFGENAILAVQPVANGTGGALKAAAEFLRECEAEFIGVAFGDEPFLDKSIFVQTFMDHFIKMSDITLCGKVPESVEARGGLFFDENGKFMGTKEWSDMSKTEQDLMRQKLAEGKAYTNTGITFIRRKLALERIDRLKPHANGEYHHVDLIRTFYEDQLATNAYIYRGEVAAGVNKWENVRDGERILYSQWQKSLVNLGVRVDPKAQVSIAIGGPKLKPNFQVGRDCHILGKCHIGYGVKIGDYCQLENATLMEKNELGDLVSLKNVTLENVKVGKRAVIENVKANFIIIPSEVEIKDRTLGFIRGMNERGIKPQLSLGAIVSSGYKAGLFKFGEKLGLPDWERLRKHILTHCENELIPRATKHGELQKTTLQAVEELLSIRRNGNYIFDEFTPEEVWGIIYQMVELFTKNPDPYKREKIESEAVALKLLEKFEKNNVGATHASLLQRRLDWKDKVKICIAANIIDYTSNTVLGKLRENPNYFESALESALESELSIDDLDKFKVTLIDSASSSKRLVWLTDNSGEVVFDLWVIEHLVQLGHVVTIAAKSKPISNDTTLTEVKDLLKLKPGHFKGLRNIEVISSGSTTVGTEFYQATPEFIAAILNADLVISKGQGNWYTTQGLLKDRFYLLMSKGMTCELSTGVVADKTKLIDGMILAFVPAGVKIDGKLKDFVELRQAGER